MSKIMFHRLTIRVPSEMVLQNKKTGKLKLVQRLRNLEE